MWWTYPVFLFYKFFRGRSFDFDFDELDAEGKKYSNKQGIVYHYFGDAYNQTLFDSVIVHWKDFWLGLLGFPGLIVVSIIYWSEIAYNIVLFPVYAFWYALTPWKEKQGEGFLIWFSGAVEAGVDPGFPDNLYTNGLLLPGAEAMRQEYIDEVLEEIEK